MTRAGCSGEPPSDGRREAFYAFPVALPELEPHRVSRLPRPPAATSFRAVYAPLSDIQIPDSGRSKRRRKKIVTTGSGDSTRRDYRGQSVTSTGADDRATVGETLLRHGNDNSSAALSPDVALIPG